MTEETVNQIKWTIHETHPDKVQIAREKLSEIRGIKFLGPDDMDKRSGVLSFVIDGIHPHDVGSFLDEQGIMIRVGDHCARPLHKKLKIPASCRMSFHIYNTKKDIDRAAEALQKLVCLFEGRASKK